MYNIPKTIMHPAAHWKLYRIPYNIVQTPNSPIQLY